MGNDATSQTLRTPTQRHTDARQETYRRGTRSSTQCILTTVGALQMSRIDTRPTPNGLEHGATMESSYARCSTEALQNDTSDTATHQLPRLMEAVSAGTYSLLALGEDN